MAAAVVERSFFVAPRSLAYSSGSCSGSKHFLQQWQLNSRRFLSGTSIQHLTAATKTHRHKMVGMRQSGQPRGKYDPTKKKPIDPIDDPFNFGEDEDMEYGSLMSSGKQSLQVPKPPKDKKSKEGYLDFPYGYNLEIASLGLYIRDDVRRCLCWVAGGVYENLLFFPVIQLVKNRYPGALIDIVAGERGKQVYEMNKHINRSYVFDTDAEWTVPADLTEFIGTLRNEYYDLILSTTYAGFKHASVLFMVGGRTRRVSYVPKYHSEWVSTRFLSEAIEAPREILAEGGFNMYEEILAYVAQPGKGVPQEEIPTLQVGVNKRVRSVVREKENEAGLSEGKFVVFHGIESDSAASMTSRGDFDSLLPLHLLGQLTKQIQDSTGAKVVVVIPHQRERPKVIEACGNEVSIVFITTPGQLGSLIKDSAGVVSTNTAAMPMAVALGKPSVALFGSAEKASVFVPSYADKIKVVASKTGKLKDVDIAEASSAWRFVSEGQLALTA